MKKGAYIDGHGACNSHEATDTKRNPNEKQRHIGRTILLIVLAIIILIPVAAYSYLAISCKNIEKTQTIHDPDAVYGGMPSLPADGGLEVKLSSLALIFQCCQGRAAFILSLTTTPVSAAS